MIDRKLENAKKNNFGRNQILSTVLYFLFELTLISFLATIFVKCVISTGEEK